MTRERSAMLLFPDELHVFAHGEGHPASVLVSALASRARAAGLRVVWGRPYRRADEPAVLAAFSEACSACGEGADPVSLLHLALRVVEVASARRDVERVMES